MPTSMNRPEELERHEQYIIADLVKPSVRPAGPLSRTLCGSEDVNLSALPHLTVALPQRRVWRELAEWRRVQSPAKHRARQLPNCSLP